MAQVAVLPKNVPLDDFMKAADEYRAIVGPDNVLIDPDRLVPYERMMIPGALDSFRPSGALIASSTEQVQRIVGVCNKYNIPVWPISTGGNFGYGERLPAVPGQMVLDLGRMKKFEIDTELSTALVEPGVTYTELYEYLNANGIPLWLSVPGPGAIVGPVGQALERGQGYTDYGEQYDSLCGMEVVLADGSVLRTGLGGVAGSTAWQAYKFGYGPYLDGMFTQSNFGIVTKIGIWLAARPAVIKMFAGTFDRFEDGGNAVAAARDLKLHNLVQGPLLAGMPLGGFQMSMPRDRFKKDPGPITRTWLADYLKSKSMGQFACFGSITGSPAEVDAKYAEAKRILHAHGASGVVDDLLLQLAPAYPHLRKAAMGGPDLAELRLLDWVPGGGAVWFAPVCPSRAAEVLAQMDLAWGIIEDHGFDYDGGFFVNGRSALHVIALLFDKSDSAQNARVIACYNELLTRFTANGWGQYRTNVAYMEQTAQTFGPAQRAINRTLKAALDPNSIIAPGKSGIG